MQTQHANKNRQRVTAQKETIKKNKKVVFDSRFMAIA